MAGERIRDYLVEGLIGRGGMGSVYLASHVHLNTKAALKVLLEQYSEDSSIKNRFVNEARLLHSLQHPNIVLQKEFFEENGRLVLVMEYVDGRGLDKMIGHEVGPIPWEKALPLFSQLLSGVGYAHSRGVIHRDIKPANILVSKEGEVKITDFGIAKIAGQKGMTRTGAQMGTLYYESPEQIKGARDVDHRADIYALGMTLYEMLAGRLPFDDGGDTSEYAIMDSIVKREEHLDPRNYYPHIPEWLVNVVQKSTELDAEKRYQDCDSFQRAIQEHGGNLNTGEHAYWSGRVASVPSVTPISAGLTAPTTATSTPENSCPKCGVTVKDEMAFCMKCGTALNKSCPECSTPVRWDAHFCSKCGVPIAGKIKEIHGLNSSKSTVKERYGRFLLNKSTGVITDTSTGNLWLVGPDQDTDWNEAKTWAEDIGDGWRMPTSSELKALYLSGISAANWGPFENSGWRVWSSGWRVSGESHDSSQAWNISFISGDEYWRPRSGSDCKRGFAVRLR